MAYTRVTNPFISFLQENILRIAAKSPRFFQIWKIISGALVLITSVPDTLAMFQIHIPELFAHHIEVAVRCASAGVLFMSFMSVQPQSVALDQEGQTLLQMDPDKLPFTSRHVEKQTAKNQAVDQLPTVDVSPSNP